VGILTKIDNAFSAAKTAYKSGSSVAYERLEDGTHAYTFLDNVHGPLSLLGIGDTYARPKENLKYYYANTLFLQDCINLYADFASQVEIMEVDENGNEIEDSDFIKLLNNPNPFQSRTEFIKEMTINCLASGVVYQHGNFFKNGNLRVNPLLYNLEFTNLSFPAIKNKYSLSRKDIKELKIKEYLADNKHRNIEFGDLAFFYDTIPNAGWGEKGYSDSAFFKPMARMFSIIKSVNTVLNAQSSMEHMTGNNVNKVLSKEPTAAGGLAVLPSDQKNDTETKINGHGRYGMRTGKVGDIVVTNESLKVLDLTRDNKKMQMIEMKESAKEDIRNCYLIPKDFFGDSTYENKQFSEARLILGGVKSITDNWLNSLENKAESYFLSRRTKLVGRYDHIPSVAETKKKLENEGFLMRAGALEKAITVFNQMVLIEPKLTWKEFIRVNQFNDHLMIKA
jgi:hypothetical protein